MQPTPSISIPLELLDPHPNNPRGPVDPASVEELAASIREKGIIEPLIVVPVRNPGQSWKIERYLTVAGHRRRVAARLAGLTEAPAIVREFSPGEQEEIMLVENIQREDLSLLQEARAYRRRVDTGLTFAEVARRVGVSHGRVQQRMVIFKLPESVQRLFDGKDMPITAAPLLLKIHNPDRQERLARMIATRRLAVPALKEMLDKEAEAAETDMAVEKSRAGGKTAGRQPRTPTQVYTRSDAVSGLERRNGDTLKYSDVLQALHGVCDGCGMGAHAAICAACPLPQLINNLVKHASTQTV